MPIQSTKVCHPFKRSGDMPILKANWSTLITHYDSFGCKRIGIILERNEFMFNHAAHSIGVPANRRLPRIGIPVLDHGNIRLGHTHPKSNLFLCKIKSLAFLLELFDDSLIRLNGFMRSLMKQLILA